MSVQAPQARLGSRSAQCQPPSTQHTPNLHTSVNGLPLLLRAMAALPLLATGLACSFTLERSGSCLKEPTPTPSGPSVMADAPLDSAGPAGAPPSRNMEGGAAMVGVVAACGGSRVGNHATGWGVGVGGHGGMAAMQQLKSRHAITAARAAAVCGIRPALS